MSQRYFRTDSDAAYEQARATLDSLWQLPTGVTCFTPAATAPRDSQGRIVLAVDLATCEYHGVPDLLGRLIASGVVVEISESEYDAAIPRDVSPRPEQIDAAFREAAGM